MVISSPFATASKTSLKLRATSVAVMIFFIGIRLSDSFFSIKVIARVLLEFTGPSTPRDGAVEN
jgi:hypothetical protein